MLANADSHFSEIERATGWKGARLTVGFLFYDLRNNVPLTDATVVFQGICNPPDQIKESTFRLTATNRMNLQRLLLAQRAHPAPVPLAVSRDTGSADGGGRRRRERQILAVLPLRLFGGLDRGQRNSERGAPFTVVRVHADDCQARGMLTRFGGLEFVPPAIAVRSYGKDWSTSAVCREPGPLQRFRADGLRHGVVQPMVVFARNDGNLTRMEVLLGIGQMQGVLTVLVNGSRFRWASLAPT